jgi:hypothetical protein
MTLLISIDGEFIELSLEYIYNYIYLPTNDSDIILTDKFGNIIYDGEGNQETYESNPELFIFNNIYGFKNYQDISSLDLTDYRDFDLFVRITKLSNVESYFELNGNSIISIGDLYNYLYEYFYNIPTDNPVPSLYYYNTTETDLISGYSYNDKEYPVNLIKAVWNETNLDYDSFFYLEKDTENITADEPR